MRLSLRRECESECESESESESGSEEEETKLLNLTKNDELMNSFENTLLSIN